MVCLGAASAGPEAFANAFDDLVTWCNGNAGFLSAVLTFVYVAATVCLVLLAYLQFRAAFQLERSRSRPLVVLDFLTEHAFVHVTLKNFGHTTAHNIKVVSDPEIHTLHGGPDSVPATERDDPIAFIVNGVAMMPPQREIKSAVGYWPRFESRYPELRFSGHISYTALDGTAYRESFTIHLAAQKGLMHIRRYDLHDLAEEVKNLQKEVHLAVTGIHKPLIRVVDDDVYRRRERRQLKRDIQFIEKKGLFKDSGRHRRWRRISLPLGALIAVVAVVPFISRMGKSRRRFLCNAPV